MSKYEVWVKRWSEETHSTIKVVAGKFTEYLNAKLFAQAYFDRHFYEDITIKAA